MSYPSDLSDAQWELLKPLLIRTSKRGPKHGADLRTVVDAMLYISKTGCQWRYLPSEFGKWTRVWSRWPGERRESGDRVLARLISNGAFEVSEVGVLRRERTHLEELPTRVGDLDAMIAELEEGEQD